MQSVLPFVDILFGNDDEYRAFAVNFNLNTTDLATIASKIGAMPKKNSKRSRIVIITQGEKPVILHRGMLRNELLLLWVVLVGNNYKLYLLSL